MWVKNVMYDLQASCNVVHALQVDDQFRQLLSGIEADPMVVHFADIPRIMVSTHRCLPAC